MNRLKRRVLPALLAVLLLLTACGAKPAESWQEQYDLGVRYLSEGNYQEAILAFSAAIDIDPKRADAYVKLADAYTAQGDKVKAAEVLTQALSAIGENEAVSAALAALGVSTGVSTPDDSSGESSAPAGQPGEPLPLAPSVRSERTDSGDRYYIREFDAEGRVVRLTWYNADGTATYIQEYFYDAQGNLVALKASWPGDEHILYQESRLDLLERETETTEYRTDGSVHKWTYLYDGTTVTVSADFTNADGKTAVGTFSHTLLNAENELQLQSYSWSFDDGKVDSIDLQEYNSDWVMVASVCINVDRRRTGDIEQLHCRYEGVTVHMTYTGTSDGAADTVSMVYTMSSPDNFITEGQSSSWQISDPPHVVEISFIEADFYTGEWTDMVYDAETNTFSRSEY